MERKVYLAEYLNLINENNVPIGHAPKVISENCLLIDSSFKPTIICGKLFANSLSNNEGVISIHDVYYRANKAFMFFKRITNIKKIFKYTEENSLIWFTNVDWVLFFYLALFHKKNRRLMVTLYRDITSDLKSYESLFRRILGKISSIGLRRIDLFIVTNPDLKLFNNQINIPDYYYTSKYEKYISCIRKDRIVCLGSMRGTKDLLGLVEHFNDSDIEVLIEGDFLDKEEYRAVKTNASRNITVLDKVLPFEEYYKLLGESKYAILPYKGSWYENATSGILLESVFLGVIPIAPNWLLKHNHINGIGYDTMSELPRTIKEMSVLGNTINNRIDDYRIENIQKLLEKGINTFCE